MKTKYTEFEVIDYLKTNKQQQAYLESFLEDGTDEEILRALSDIARARGMTRTAEDAGITREGLYKALSEKGNPSFRTLDKIVRALGFRISIVPAK